MSVAEEIAISLSEGLYDINSKNNSNRHRVTAVSERSPHRRCMPTPVSDFPFTKRDPPPPPPLVPRVLCGASLPGSLTSQGAGGALRGSWS
jgi:hypothetical protein